jgi:HEAT repeat protein
MLAQWGCVEAAPDMEKIFVEGEDTLYPDRRSRDELIRSAALALATLDPTAAGEVLPRYLTHRNDSYRVSAVEGLAFVQGEEFTEDLVYMLDDESWDVRLSTCVALAKRPYAEMRERMAEMLSDGDFFTVRAALEILSQQVGEGLLKVEDADSELVEFLKELAEGEVEHHAKDAAAILSRFE